MDQKTWQLWLLRVLTDIASSTLFDESAPWSITTSIAALQALRMSAAARSCLGGWMNIQTSMT
ncbi:hypothetical protein AF72_12960 [Xylella taiwanensis]|uniref:Uncharacterized protein n=1 Tax=Xylella taiwanensis TaxID=1444770 RepID=Z9JH38_9GAMM|nr:hypothetical protein AB672_10885 [Xylella taiwanensis]EWS77032.1 hypothetical protein AF72_12960 [Xylella taiwanensis]